MRLLLLVCPLLGLACGEEPGAAPAAAPLPVLKAYPIERGDVVLDGGAADPAWRRIKEIDVPLTGPGPDRVKLKAAYDGERLYLLAMWKDAERSMNRYWRYLGKLKWEKFTGEDAFSIWWSPGSMADAFRERGCALFCHGERHVYADAERGFSDVWFYGTQQCALNRQARDMWLPFGKRQRLRGDRQPAESDNLPNISELYEGPRYWPVRINKSTPRLLVRGNLNEVTPERVRKHMRDASNIGREIPLDILQPRRGSRGDVAYAADFYKGTGYVLELARDLRTGHGDDIVLDPDPLVAYLFCLAVHDGTAGGEHAISRPVELVFLAEGVGSGCRWGRHRGPRAATTRVEEIGDPDRPEPRGS